MLASIRITITSDDQSGSRLPWRYDFSFRRQILNGRSWVIVDGAVLDISSFAKRHPGGARLIMNALGTDVTSEITGDEASIGNFKRAFTPHTHTDVSSNYLVFVCKLCALA